jgi:hypothetical protein
MQCLGYSIVLSFLNLNRKGAVSRFFVIFWRAGCRDRYGVSLGVSGLLISSLVAQECLPVDHVPTQQGPFNQDSVRDR